MNILDMSATASVLIVAIVIVRTVGLYHWLKAHSLRRSIQVRQTDRTKAPLTYGIFRPVILLPKRTDLTDETSLRYVLAHEYTHIRHFDALTKLVLPLYSLRLLHQRTTAGILER